VWGALVLIGIVLALTLGSNFSVLRNQSRAGVQSATRSPRPELKTHNAKVDTHNPKALFQNFLPDIGADGRVWQIAMAGGFLTIALLYFLHFTATYFDNTKEMYLGWGCFLAILLMYKLKSTRRQPCV